MPRIITIKPIKHTTEFDLASARRGELIHVDEIDRPPLNRDVIGAMKDAYRRVPPRANQRPTIGPLGHVISAPPPHNNVPIVYEAARVKGLSVGVAKVAVDDLPEKIARELDEAFPMPEGDETSDRIVAARNHFLGGRAQEAFDLLIRDDVKVSAVAEVFQDAQVRERLPVYARKLFENNEPRSVANFTYNYVRHALKTREERIQFLEWVAMAMARMNDEAMSVEFLVHLVTKRHAPRLANDILNIGAAGSVNEKMPTRFLEIYALAAFKHPDLFVSPTEIEDTSNGHSLYVRGLVKTKKELPVRSERTKASLAAGSTDATNAVEAVTEPKVVSKASPIVADVEMPYVFATQEAAGVSGQLLINIEAGESLPVSKIQDFFASVDKAAAQYNQCPIVAEILVPIDAPDALIKLIQHYCVSIWGRYQSLYGFQIVRYKGSWRPKDSQRVFVSTTVKTDEPYVKPRGMRFVRMTAKITSSELIERQQRRSGFGFSGTKQDVYLPGPAEIEFDFNETQSHITNDFEQVDVEIIVPLWLSKDLSNDRLHELIAYCKGLQQTYTLIHGFRIIGTDGEVSRHIGYTKLIKGDYKILHDSTKEESDPQK